MGEKQLVRDQNLILNLPDLQGNKHSAQLNWIEDLGDGYFRAGLSYVCGYPYDGGSCTWMLKLDPDIGFKPLFCADYWDPRDEKETIESGTKK